MSKKHKFWKGVFNFQIVDKFGNVKEAWCVENDLADEGEKLILDVMFGDAVKPSTYYLRLFNDTPVETDTLSDLTGEASGNGYSAFTLNNDTTDFPTRALDSGDWQVTSKAYSFIASGGPIPVSGSVTYAVLATSSDNTGKLVSFVELSTPRTLAEGEQLTGTYSIKLQ